MLEEFKKDNDMFHSDYQIENFILIQNGHTPYGTYKQALRELFAREQSLRGLYAKELEMQIDLETVELDIKQSLENIAVYDESGDHINSKRESLKIKKLKIAQASLDFALVDMVHVKRETEREYRKFYSCARYLKEKLGDLSVERKAKLEAEYWKETIKDAIASDIKSIGGVDPKTLKRIEDCGFEERCELQSLVHALKTDKVVCNGFLNAYPNRTPFPKDLNLELPCDIKLLVEQSSAPVTN